MERINRTSWPPHFECGESIERDCVPMVLVVPAYHVCMQYEVRFDSNRGSHKHLTYELKYLHIKFFKTWLTCRYPFILSADSKSLPKARRNLPKQQKVTRQEDLKGCTLLEGYRARIQDPQGSHRRKLCR